MSLQSAVDAGRESDKNPFLCAVPETMILLANFSISYQIMDRSRNTVARYLAKIECMPLIINISFEKVVQVNITLYEVELAKAEI